jgi:hypothetical protein
VAQQGGGLHLALEALQQMRVAGPLRVNQLDGARPLEQAVLGQVNLAHPAGAEQPLQVVLAKLPGRQRLPLQRADLERAEHRQRRRNQQPHRREAHQQAHLLADDRLLQPGQQRDAQGNKRQDRHDHDAAPPGVGNEHAVADDEEVPHGVVDQDHLDDEHVSVARPLPGPFRTVGERREAVLGEECYRQTEQHHLHPPQCGQAQRRQDPDDHGAGQRAEQGNEGQRAAQPVDVAPVHRG